MKKTEIEEIIRHAYLDEKTCNDFLNKLDDSLLEFGKQQLEITRTVCVMKTCRSLRDDSGVSMGTLYEVFLRLFTDPSPLRLSELVDLASYKAFIWSMEWFSNHEMFLDKPVVAESREQRVPPIRPIHGLQGKPSINLESVEDVTDLIIFFKAQGFPTVRQIQERVARVIRSYPNLTHLIEKIPTTSTVREVLATKQRENLILVKHQITSHGQRNERTLHAADHLRF